MEDFSEHRFFLLADSFFTSAVLFFYTGYFLRFFSNFFGFFASYLIPNVSVSFSSFIISNDNISAQFVAHFIGRKLLQGHRVRDVVRPIMKELYVRSRFIATSRLGALFFNREHLITPEYQNSVIKSYALKFLTIYKRLFYRFFFSHCTWISLYFYDFLTFFFFRFVSYEKLLLGCCKSFMLRKHSFLFFFNLDYSYLNNNLCFVFNDIFFDFSSRRSAGCSFFLFSVYDILFSNFSSIFFGQLSHTWQGTDTYDIAFMATNVFFNRVVTFSYWDYKYR